MSSRVRPQNPFSIHLHQSLNTTIELVSTLARDITENSSPSKSLQRVKNSSYAQEQQSINTSFENVQSLKKIVEELSIEKSILLTTGQILDEINSLLPKQ